MLTLREPQTAPAHHQVRLQVTGTPAGARASRPPERAEVLSAAPSGRGETASGSIRAGGTPALLTATAHPTPQNRSGGTGVSGVVPQWKRILDVSLIVFCAPFWLPLMLVLATGIKCLSPGPVLFRQERIGHRGRRFLCLKFRTMHTGISTAVHEQHVGELIRSNQPMTKLDGRDPRLIPLAWLLRSSGLDELPQLFNVLRGDMSLVGPRPCTPPEYAAYSIEQRARLETLPGLTGLWQVSGKNRTTFHEMIELDVRYARTLSLPQDLIILLRTVGTLHQEVTTTLLDRRSKASPRPARTMPLSSQSAWSATPQKQGAADNQFAMR